MHTSVLASEAIKYLEVRSNGIYVDCTAGRGGHSEKILEKLGANGMLVLSDRDPTAVEFLKNKFGSDTRCLVNLSRFSGLEDILKKETRLPVDGLLADLGISGSQLGLAERGFSFQLEGPLDMRMDPDCRRTAGDFLEELGEKELADLFFGFGEERHSRKMARAIVQQRKTAPLRTTTELKTLAEKVLGPFYRKAGIHPATRIFQALRIAVNGEVDELNALVKELPGIAAPGGRAVIISFHSLEDRIVKRGFQSLKKEGWKILTKKPVRPGEVELKNNPRSRSAKLRAVERPC